MIKLEIESIPNWIIIEFPWIPNWKAFEIESFRNLKELKLKKFSYGHQLYNNRIYKNSQLENLWNFLKFLETFKIQ